MYFVIKNEIYLFIPKILVILADIAEAVTFTSTYLLLTFKQSCHFCLISNKDLNNMVLTHINLWISEETKEVTDINQTRKLLIHTDFNFFKKFDDSNIYEAIVSDRMHMLDFKITKYFLEFTCEYLQ
jgi:hypothetical protein